MTGKSFAVMIAATALFLCACAGAREPDSQISSAAETTDLEKEQISSLTETTYLAEEQISSAAETTQEDGEGAEAARESTLPAETEEKIKEHDSRMEYVGFEGHVKEVQEDRVLISSDTDDFPGVFWVTNVFQETDPEELKGGARFFVLAEDTKQEDNGIRIYRAEHIYEISDEKRGQEDILLTSPPSVSFGDLLSSTLHDFSVQPGSYSWNTSEGTGAIACKAAHLDETVIRSAAKLKVPAYNGMDKVLYGYSTVVPPDKMEIRQWDVSEAGNVEAEEECLTVYYAMPFWVELEKGKIYEVYAEWKKENPDSRGFWGNADYLFVTE